MSKSLVKNSLYSVIYRIINIVFPLITSIYVARILQADSIGKVAAAQNLAQYFTLAAAMGIPTYGVKLIAQYKTGSLEMRKSFTELFVINFILSILCSFIYYLIVYSLPFYANERMLYSLVGLNIIFNVINVDWFYQGVQEYRYITFRSMLIKMLSLFFLIIFVKKQSDYLLYAFISSIALVGNYLFNIINLHKFTSFYFKDLTFKKHLKHIIVLFSASIAAEIYVLADTTMLNILCGSRTVGYYTMSMKIIKIIRSLVVAVSAVFLPKLSYYYYNDDYERFINLSNKGIHILTAISIPASLGVFLVASDMISILYGSGFEPSILTTQIVALSICTVAFSNFIGMQVLVTIGKEWITTLSTITGMFINIILNLFLIPLYQQNGAAFASMITELSVMILQIIIAKKYISLDFKMKKTIIASVFMVGTVLLIQLFVNSLFIRFILECSMGLIMYLLISFILKDSFIYPAFQMIKDHYKLKKEGL